MSPAMKTLLILWLTPGVPPPGPFGEEKVKGWVLRIDIYEKKPYPVVRHEFRGRTVEEAKRYAMAHAKYDSFLQECVLSGRFDGFDCRAVRKWIAIH